LISPVCSLVKKLQGDPACTPLGRTAIIGEIHGAGGRIERAPPSAASPRSVSATEFRARVCATFALPVARAHDFPIPWRESICREGEFQCQHQAASDSRSCLEKFVHQSAPG
jgi:hypothetical protein